jgi:hypothetical protein
MHLLKAKKLSRIVLSLEEPEALLFLEGWTLYSTEAKPMIFRHS